MRLPVPHRRIHISHSKASRKRHPKLLSLSFKTKTTTICLYQSNLRLMLYLKRVVSLRSQFLSATSLCILYFLVLSIYLVAFLFIIDFRIDFRFSSAKLRLQPNQRALYNLLTHKTDAGPKAYQSRPLSIYL